MYSDFVDDVFFSLRKSSHDFLSCLVDEQKDEKTKTEHGYKIYSRQLVRVF